MKNALSMILAVVLFTGCATMINSPRQQVTLKAANDDKIVVVVEGQKHTLPATLKLKRKGEMIYIYNADNPKYADSVVNSWVLNGPQNMGFRSDFMSLDVLCILLAFVPGVVAMAVDGGTGSAFEYMDTKLVVPVYPKK